eukprot:3666929-Rhodomonas_salina.2
MALRSGIAVHWRADLVLPLRFIIFFTYKSSSYNALAAEKLLSPADCLWLASACVLATEHWDPTTQELIIIKPLKDETDKKQYKQCTSEDQ